MVENGAKYGQPPTHQKNAKIQNFYLRANRYGTPSNGWKLLKKIKKIWIKNFMAKFFLFFGILDFSKIWKLAILNDIWWFFLERFQLPGCAIGHKKIKHDENHPKILKTNTKLPGNKMVGHSERFLMYWCVGLTNQPPCWTIFDDFRRFLMLFGVFFWKGSNFQGVPRATKNSKMTKITENP